MDIEILAAPDHGGLWAVLAAGHVDPAGFARAVADHPLTGAAALGVATLDPAGLVPLVRHAHVVRLVDGTGFAVIQVDAAVPGADPVTLIPGPDHR